MMKELLPRTEGCGPETVSYPSMSTTSSMRPMMRRSKFFEIRPAALGWLFIVMKTGGREREFPLCDVTVCERRMLLELGQASLKLASTLQRVLRLDFGGIDYFYFKLRDMLDYTVIVK